MTDLNELQVFVQVAQERSVTRAARRLGMPKSSVSRTLARLEDRLGVRLLERTTRSIALTGAGELYLERCSRVVEEAEQADMLMGALRARPQGKLRVGVSVAFARTVLGPVLEEFLTLYPELKLHLLLSEGGAPSQEKPAQRRNLDLWIQPGPLEDSELLVRPLLRIRLGLYAGSGYLSQHPAPASPAALVHHHTVAASCGVVGEPALSSRWRLRRGRHVEQVRVDPRVTVPDPLITHQLALSGVGIAVLAQFLAHPDEHAGRLRRILPEWEPEPVELYAVYPSRLHRSPNVRAFLEFVALRCGKHALGWIAPAAIAAGLPHGKGERVSAGIPALPADSDCHATDGA